MRKVLVTPAADILSEIYLGIVMDRSRRRAVMMASAAGGMDIEQVAVEAPEKIVKVAIDPFVGLADHVARDIAAYIGLDKAHWADFIKIAKSLAQVYAANDASMAEINPLAFVKSDQRPDGKMLMALDGKIVIDDNAMFRHPELEPLRDPDEDTEAEKQRPRRRFELCVARWRHRLPGQRRRAGHGHARHDPALWRHARPTSSMWQAAQKPTKSPPRCALFWPTRRSKS